MFGIITTSSWKKKLKVTLAKQRPEVMELIIMKLSGRDNSQVNSTPPNLFSHPYSEKECSYKFIKFKDFVMAHCLGPNYWLRLSVPLLSPSDSAKVGLEVILMKAFWLSVILFRKWEVSRFILFPHCTRVNYLVFGFAILGCLIVEIALFSFCLNCREMSTIGPDLGVKVIWPDLVQGNARIYSWDEKRLWSPD